MTSKTIRTVKLFEFYVRKIWPIHRYFVQNKISKRCRICITSEKMLPLNQAGLCSECAVIHRTQILKARPIDEKRLQELNNILVNAQGSGKRNYDALILFSGGKDSTYLIRRIRDQFPRLRILTFTLHNGFISPVALENLEDLITRLDVDHIFIRPKKSFYIQLFRYCLQHLNQDGSYGTVDFSDGEFLLDSARNIAVEKEIPLILAGYSRYQVENGLKLVHFESPQEKELADRTETAGIPLKDIFNEEDIKMWWQGSKYSPGQVARLLFPLFVWDLDEEEIKKKVAEWGLLSKYASSPILTNHQLVPLLGVVDVHQLGYSSFEKEFCRMIREGKASKDDWQHIFEFLEYTARTGFFVRSTVIELLAKLELTIDDVKIHFKK